MTPNKPDSGNPLFSRGAQATGYFPAGHRNGHNGAFPRVLYPLEGTRNSFTRSCGVGAGLYTTRFGSPVAAYAGLGITAYPLEDVAAASKWTPWVSQGHWAFCLRRSPTQRVKESNPQVLPWPGLRNRFTAMALPSIVCPRNRHGNEGTHSPEGGCRQTRQHCFRARDTSDVQ